MEFQVRNRVSFCKDANDPGTRVEGQITEEADRDESFKVEFVKYYRVFEDGLDGHPDGVWLPASRLTKI